MKLLGGKKKILPLKKLHCISSAAWKCFVAEYFLQNMRIAKLTSPDAALESGLSASHIQRDTFLTAMCSSQCGHPGKTGLIFLPFLLRENTGKTDTHFPHSTATRDLHGFLRMAYTLFGAGSLWSWKALLDPGKGLGCQADLVSQRGG